MRCGRAVLAGLVTKAALVAALAAHEMKRGTPLTAQVSALGEFQPGHDAQPCHKTGATQRCS